MTLDYPPPPEFPDDPNITIQIYLGSMYYNPTGPLPPYPKTENRRDNDPSFTVRPTIVIPKDIYNTYWNNILDNIHEAVLEIGGLGEIIVDKKIVLPAFRVSFYKLIKPLIGSHATEIKIFLTVQRDSE